MKKLLNLFFIASILSLAFFVGGNFNKSAKAENNECVNISSLNLEAIGRCLSDIQKAYEMSVKATKPLESQLNSFQTQIKAIKDRVADIESNISTKKENINQGYRNLEKQEKILKRTIRNFYIKSYYNSPILTFLSTASASKITQILAYQKAATDQDKVIITNIALSITDLENKKRNLENEQTRLASIKKSLDEESGKLEEIVKGAKTYQANLSSQIAQLSAKQQQIIGQRLAGLNLPRSAGTIASACVDDRDKDPGFSPRFAFFTYGVPNRVGMNQYGAYGRARANQDYSTILHAYYNFDELKDIDINTQIRVDNHGTYNIEDYVKRIYEVPNSWGDSGGMEALKAQAIAARSYAMAYTNNGAGSICDSQSCQVFQDGEKGGNWNSAVEATRGKVMTQGGQTIKAWFSSTHGGYILATGELPGWQSTSWTKHATDTTTGSAASFGDLNSNAYDKDSPWFYCDWGSRAEYNKTAWLKNEEIADIVNIILLARADSSTKDHLYQADKPHPYGGEVWNQEKVKSELKSRNITAYNNVSDVSMSVDFGSGKTNSVNISGDGSSQSFDGLEFKDWFNLRAPANIQIVGPLFNIEKR